MVAADCLGMPGLQLNRALMQRPVAGDSHVPGYFAHVPLTVVASASFSIPMICSWCVFEWISYGWIYWVRWVLVVLDAYGASRVRLRAPDLFELSDRAESYLGGDRRFG